MTSDVRDTRASAWVVWAWVSVALIPVFLAAVSYASLLFFRETRYEGADHYIPEWANGMPLWALLLQSLIAVTIVAVPCVSAMWCGGRATSAGDRRGRTPQVLGIVALVLYAVLVLLNTVGGSLGWLGGPAPLG